MSICNPVLYCRSQVLALQAFGCESEHPNCFLKGVGLQRDGAALGEGRESPWWELSRASTGSGSALCVCEGLKEVGAFLRFKKGGERQRRNCAFL